MTSSELPQSLKVEGEAEAGAQGAFERLREDVEACFPEAGRGGVAVWRVFILGNPRAPIVSVSRDPRVGPKLTPVFFVTMRDQAALLDLAKSLYRQSGEIAGLCHWVAGERTGSYLLVPALFHMHDDLEAFRETVAAVLHGAGCGGDLAWFCEDCEVLIEHHGVSYRAVPGSQGVPIVVAR